jgi:hypothetical protein
MQRRRREGHEEFLFQRLALIVMLAVVATGVAAQRGEPITAARVRALEKEAESEGKGDKTEIVLALDRKFRQRWGEFESFPVSIVKREDLTVVLSMPFMTYRRALAEYLRMDNPVAGIPWVDSAVITVAPIQIGSPDIREIIVSRNGKPVAPLDNRLKAMSFANGNGQTAVIHAGEVRFPLSALAPGARVVVTAIPATGDPFIYTLDESQLQILK